ncbi:MAG: hypothetical protein HZA34_04680 [Candidatus Pacebacteria bacterium]|nr:hypothetical protein [Candidatus Paceibacterota bacterium]
MVEEENQETPEEKLENLFLGIQSTQKAANELKTDTLASAEEKQKLNLHLLIQIEDYKFYLEQYDMLDEKRAEIISEMKRSTKEILRSIGEEIKLLKKD